MFQAGPIVKFVEPGRAATHMRKIFGVVSDGNTNLLLTILR